MISLTKIKNIKALAQKSTPLKKNFTLIVIIKDHRVKQKDISRGIESSEKFKREEKEMSVVTDIEYKNKLFTKIPTTKLTNKIMVYSLKILLFDINKDIRK